MMARALCLWVLLCLPVAAAAEPKCETGVFESVPFTACEVDPSEDKVALFHTGPKGLIGSFSALGDLVTASGDRLLLAMNAGMYHPDRRPVGLYIESGVEQARIVLSPGPGNFGLLPNGVFCMEGTTARVIESRAFANARTACDFATQSGPMLVLGGNLHPRFIPNSPSTHIRNGIGVRPDGTVVMAISDAPVNFHRFARLFRDRLGTPDALFLDGSVSRFHAPALGRSDIGLPLGPMLGVVAD